MNSQLAMPETNSTSGKFAQLHHTLNAYLSAFNEVAIVSITDLAGKIIYVNDKFLEISQYSREELIGSTHKIISSGHHPNDFFIEMWNSIGKGKPWRSEIKDKAKDGSYYWVDTVITPVKDKEGQPFQFLSVSNLISTQKQHEEKIVSFQEKLLKSEMQLKQAQELAKTGSWFIDLSTKKIEWSEETYRIFEIPENTPMTYGLFLEYIHPNDKALVDENWQKAMDSGFYEVEHRIITPSGEKWVIERAKFEFDRHFTLSTVLGTVQDITDKKLAEQLIKETATQYIGLFNNSPFAIGILDKETLRFIKVNETGIKLYGYTEKEFMKLHACDIKVPGECEEFKKQIQNDTYTHHTHIRKHRKKDGNIILVEPTITQIDYKGREAFLITINDVTEKLIIEEQLEKEKYRSQHEMDLAAVEGEEKSKSEIGRELHDNINQLLAASVLRLKNTALYSDEATAGQIMEGVDVVNKAIEEIRKLSSRIVSPPLHEFTLREAIENLVVSLKFSCKNVNLTVDVNEKSWKQLLK